MTLAPPPVGRDQPTLAALAERTGWPSDELAEVMRDEQRRGRVVLDLAGGYMLTPEAFAPEVLTALRELGYVTRQPSIGYTRRSLRPGASGRESRCRVCRR